MPICDSSKVLEGEVFALNLFQTPRPASPKMVFQNAKLFQFNKICSLADEQKCLLEDKLSSFFLLLFQAVIKNKRFFWTIYVTFVSPSLGKKYINIFNITNEL